MKQLRFLGESFLLLIFFYNAAFGANAKSPSGETREYSLPALIKRAEALYPGVEAAQAALDEMNSQYVQAKYAWTPKIQVRGLLAPAPEITCFDAAGNRDPQHCVQTNSPNINSFNINGIFASLELKIGMPVFTFGKISSAKRAASAGIAARNAQLEAAKQDIALTVAKAYWGIKLARELLYTIDDGESHLTQAQKRIENQLESGEGEATMSDLLRLKTVSAEVKARRSEAQRLERLAIMSLATLLQLDEKNFDVDKAVIDTDLRKLKSMDYYLNVGFHQRPEIKALNSALVASQEKVSLEKAFFMPDLLIVAMLSAAVAHNVDNPQNAFFNDPFNILSAGFGLALNWTIDPVNQSGKYRTAKAQAAQMEAKRKEALIGIRIEIGKSYLDLKSARERYDATSVGQKSARSWLIATSQSLAAGLAESKELSEALLAFFQLKVRYLEAIFDVNMGWAQMNRVVGYRSRSAP